MPDQQSSSKYPSLFLRLFLSHLLLLAMAFVAVLFVFDYLFEPGIKYFLLHKPLIIFPIVLALIGIAGILAAWTAGAIAAPYDGISDALESDDPALHMRKFDGYISTEEAGKLTDIVASYQERVFSHAQRKKVHSARMKSTNIIVVTVSPKGVILSANLAAEIFTGKSRQELLYGRFERYFTSGGNGTAEILGKIAASESIRGFQAATNDMSGKSRTLVWDSMPVYDTMGYQTGTLLFGNDADL